MTQNFFAPQPVWADYATAPQRGLKIYSVVTILEKHSGHSTKN